MGKWLTKLCVHIISILRRKYISRSRCKIYSKNYLLSGLSFSRSAVVIGSNRHGLGHKSLCLKHACIPEGIYFFEILPIKDITAFYEKFASLVSIADHSYNSTTRLK